MTLVDAIDILNSLSTPTLKVVKAEVKTDRLLRINRLQELQESLWYEDYIRLVLEARRNENGNAS